jgi:hypothetical protein
MIKSTKIHTRKITKIVRILPPRGRMVDGGWWRMWIQWAVGSWQWAANFVSVGGTFGLRYAGTLAPGLGGLCHPVTVALNIMMSNVFIDLMRILPCHKLILNGSILGQQPNIYLIDPQTLLVRLLTTLALSMIQCDKISSHRYRGYLTSCSVLLSSSMRFSTTL